MTESGFRSIVPGDMAFLATVYATTREQELAQVDWPPAQKEAFLAMQFAAQHSHYRTHYTDTEFLVVLHDGQDCGRFYLARWPGEWRVVELTILPAYRNLGIGTRILKDVLSQASMAGKPVTIHVEHSNRAQALYRRLGFVAVKEHGAHVLMEWQPGTSDRSHNPDVCDAN